MEGRDTVPTGAEGRCFAVGGDAAYEKGGKSVGKLWGGGKGGEDVGSCVGEG